MTSPNRKWAAFWAAIVAIGTIGEGIAVVANGGRDSFSAQVWNVLGLHAGIRSGAMVLFVIGAIWLFHHFFYAGPKDPS